MNEIQEWRDRCAKAMGFEYGEGKGPLIDGSLRTYAFWIGNDPECYFDHDDWRPDEDYNQAMMMRDSLDYSEKDKYAKELLGVCLESRTRGPLFATARQIAEAALKVLEEAKNNE